VGDIGAAAEHAERLGRHRTPATSRYIELWRRLVREEEARRSGVRQSSRRTREELLEEANRLWAPQQGPGPRTRWAVVALVCVLAIGSSLGADRACVGVEILLMSEIAGRGGSPPLADALLREPEPGASVTYEAAMDLEAAAESRHDPDTREQLIAAGFAGAYVREWQATDGRRIHADVFEFHDGAGAIAFQSTVNRYACRFSNEAFEGPVQGIGLQVRWSRGDPIEEQISWVMDNRRYLVSVRAIAPPDDHERIRTIAERAARLLDS
jgi:hypothetical protein